MALVQSIISEYGMGAIGVAVVGDELNVEVDPSINIEEVTKDDDDPMFVNVEIIRNGISDGNNREYTADVVMDLVSAVPGTLGYLGHPDPSKTSFEFRDPQCIYVGAKTVQNEFGDTVRLIGKCYIFKNSPLREWIPKSIACNNPLTVSIHGKGDVSVDRTNGTVHVHRITKLECIDWANPGTQGMPRSKALSVVSELQGGNEMERNQIIQSVTLAEMQEHNEAVIKEAVNTVVANMTLSELQAINPALVTEVEQKATISEMKLSIDGQETMIPLADVQNVVNTKETKISELQGEIEAMKIESIKTALISEMVEEPYREKVAARVSGTTEEAIKASIESEIQYISEIAGTSVHDNPPRGAQARQVNDIEQSVMALFAGRKEK